MLSIPEVGERIVVHSIFSHNARAARVYWDFAAYDWIVELDWGMHGTSRVKLHDENRVWYRTSKNS
jgi:hypothetical protein